MIFLSSKIKGIGSVGKPSWVKDTVAIFGIDFLVIQETMVYTVEVVISLECGG